MKENLKKLLVGVLAFCFIFSSFLVNSPSLAETTAPKNAAALKTTKNYIDVLSAMPGPTSLSATVSGTKVKLKWGADPSGLQDGYAIFQCSTYSSEPTSYPCGFRWDSGGTIPGSKRYWLPTKRLKTTSGKSCTIDLKKKGTYFLICISYLGSPTKTISGNSKGVVVKVTGAKEEEEEEEEEPTGKGKNYALVIGEQHHLGVDQYGYYEIDNCYRNANDAANLTAMLKKVKGSSGNKWTVTKKVDVTYNGIKSAIKSAFKKATKNDICLFFIATHGNSDGDGELAMPFLGSAYSRTDIQDYLYDSKRLLPFDTLASWLKSYCKGKVLVLIQSCGAGSAIYSPGEENGIQVRSASGSAIAADLALENELTDDGAKVNGTLKMNTLKDNFDPEKFVNQAVNAFRKADEVIFDEELTDNSGVGAMRTSKFYVLAASRHHEESWGFEGGGAGYNLFTQWLIDGVGSKKKSPADVNPKNKKLTLKEMFNYIHKFDYYTYYDQYTKQYETLVQHVQVYPKNSSFVMFYWK